MTTLTTLAFLDGNIKELAVFFAVRPYSYLNIRSRPDENIYKNIRTSMQLLLHYFDNRNLLSNTLAVGNNSLIEKLWVGLSTDFYLSSEMSDCRIFLKKDVFYSYR